MPYKKADWIKIKNEYIHTNISQRNLAKKHGVSFNTLKDKANKEEWAKYKKIQRDKIATKLQQKTEGTIIDAELDRISRINDIVDRLIEKIEEATDQLNRHLVKNKKKTREIEYGKKNKKTPTKEIVKEVEETDFIFGDIDRNGLKLVVSALKDLKDITKNDKGEQTADAEKQKQLLDAIEKAVQDAD